MSTTAIPANCAAVTAALLAETGRYQQGIFRSVARKHPIVRLQSKTRGQWQKGMGATLNAITFERSFPNLATDGWVAISASDGDTTNACRPPSEQVSFGQTSRNYGPKHYSVNTEDFCIRDIETGWQYEEFVGNVTKRFADISEWIWYQRMTRDYVAGCGHFLTLRTDGIHESSVAYDVSNPPNAPMAQGVLNSIYMDLYREGGDQPSGLDEGTNQPVFTALMSSEDHQRVIQGSGVANSTGEAVRQDRRFAYMGKGEMSPLIPGMLTSRMDNYGGFVHEIETFPRHFNLVGGVYTEVAPFVSSSTTKGLKWEQNAAYKYAAFREVLIWHENVIQSLTDPTAGGISPGWDFQPQDWMGHFTPRNIIDRTCNPDGLNIFFRALFAEAAKPLDPKCGWAILVANCQPDLDLASGCYA